MQISYVLKTIIARLLIAGVVSVTAANLAAAQNITPHAAIYDLRLGRATGMEGPAGLSGTMVYVVEGKCGGGFTQRSTLDVTMLNRRGGESNLTQSFESFEAQDGLSSSFEMKIVSNGQIIDAYKGQIELDSEVGRMTYVRDFNVDELASEYTLKPGAQLSLNFTAAVAEAAKSGNRFLSRVVADGLLKDGPNRISAAIGRRLIKNTTIGDPDNLLSEPAWPVQLAYYPTSSTESLPSQEMRVELYDGGIVGKIDQDMGLYSVVTTLVDIQRAKSCDE